MVKEGILLKLKPCPPHKIIIIIDGARETIQTIFGTL